MSPLHRSHDVVIHARVNGTGKHLEQQTEMSDVAKEAVESKSMRMNKGIPATGTIRRKISRLRDSAVFQQRAENQPDPDPLTPNPE